MYASAASASSRGWPLSPRQNAGYRSGNPIRATDSASVVKRPVSPGEQLAGDLAQRIVTTDLDGAVVRLQHRFAGVPQAGLSHAKVVKQASKQASKHTPWGHTPCLPGRGWRGAVPPLTLYPSWTLRVRSKESKSSGRRPGRE